MYCRQCNYDLRHLSKHACPECGTAFDPGDPSTFRRRTGQWTLRIGLGLSTYAIVMSVVVALLMRAGRLKEPGVVIVLWTCLPAAFGGLIVLLVASARRRRWKTWLAVLLAIIALLASLYAALIAILANMTLV